jgi:DnaJ-domain-containing protein 1
MDWGRAEINMGKLGQLNTSQSIESAIRTVREWLSKLNINGLTINTNYDARLNVALVRFRYKEKEYEFRSNKQANCRLNMHGIARVMEFKVRSHIMGIEEFEKSMTAYIAIEDKSGMQNNNISISSNEKVYSVLGINSLASNEEIKIKYKYLVKSFHPDMALSEEAKKEFEKRFSEINEAYTQIKKERGLI